MNNKQAYVDKVDANIRRWQADIDKLKAATDETVADAKIDGNKQLQDISQRVEMIEGHMNALKQKGEDVWEEMKSKVDAASEELSTKIEELRSRVQ